MFLKYKISPHGYELSASMIVIITEIFSGQKITNNFFVTLNFKD